MDALGKKMTLDEYLARRGGPLKPEEEEGLFGKTLDILNRPASAIMGGVYGAVVPGMTATEGFMEGLTGQEHYGAYDLLTASGMDPESRLTRGLGLAGDVLNPLDPLNYVGLGFTKAGKLARALPGGSTSLGKFATREAAALAGEWSPVTFAGKAVLPRFLSAPVARKTDALGSWVSKSAAVETLGQYFGGVRKFEAAVPGLSRVIRAEDRLAKASTQQVADEIGKITSQLRDQGLSTLDVDRVMRETAGLLESPEDKLFRLNRELELLDDAASGKFQGWRPEDVLDPADLPRFAEANRLTQQQVDKRVGELLLRRRETGVPLAEGGALSPTSQQALRDGAPAFPGDRQTGLGLAGERDLVEDELHILQSVQVSRISQDMPPEMTDILVRRKAELRGEIDRVTRLWDDATDDARNTFKLIKPLIDDTRKIYEDILRPLDPDFEFPVADYLKHMFPAHWSKLPANVEKARKEAEAAMTTYARELQLKGYDDASIAQMVRSRFRTESALVSASAEGKAADVLRGDLDAFQRRKVDLTIAEVKEAAESGALPWEFEDHSAIIASAMRRDATRWQFGYKIHDFVSKQPGWTVKGDAYAALSKAEQKKWVPMEFHMPWIKGEKNPFRGMYMKREVSEIMKANMRGVGTLTNDAGLNAVVQTLHGMRRWWSAWTLAPFPSTRVRDFASDVLLNELGGLSPVRDMAKVATGDSSYAASLAFQLSKRKVPQDAGMWQAARGSLDNLQRQLSERFGQPVTDDTLREWMEIEGLVGGGQVRDMDLEELFSKDPVMQQAVKQRRSLASRAADWLPFQAPGRSPIIKAGFKVSETVSDYTRSALFFDALKKAAPEAQSLEQAMEFATAHVRKHLFDYSDLTTFERDVMRLVMPFYTFSSKNLPLQVTKLMTEPGRFQWTARLYEGAWDQYDDSEIAPEDLPSWLEDGLGLPMARVKGEDGAETYAIWSPRGWLPQTELNEMADLIRGKAGPQLMARLNPALKETFEQALNVDAFTMRAIDDGTVRDVMGFVLEEMGSAVGLPALDVPNSVARRAVHLINNFRLVTEVDRLDPGGAWTKIGQHMGWWENERPHRHTAPGVDRAARTLLGWNMKGVKPEEQAQRNAQSAHLDSNRALGQARKAYREGAHAEARTFMDAARAKAEEARQYQERLNELRRRRALDVAKRESN